MKILAFDIDDTILASGKCVSDRTKSAINQCRERGNKVGFITARSPRKVGHYLQGIPFDFISCYNGASTYVGNQLIGDFSMPHHEAFSTVRRILQSVPDIRKTVNFEPYCYRNTIVTDTRTDEVMDFDMANPPECNVQRIHIYLAHHESHVFSKYAGSGMAYTPTKHHTVIINAIGADKGIAVKAVTCHYGLERRDVWAFGDDASDIPMFRESGNGIAVQNALDELKRVSSAVTSSCDEDGVASYLERHLLQR